MYKHHTQNQALHIMADDEPNTDMVDALQLQAANSMKQAMIQSRIDHQMMSM